MNDYINYYNQGYYDREAHMTNIYDPYQAFIRGNSFKGLYDIYKTNEPFEIKPINEQAEMLTSIDALDFSILDLGMYLDLYSDDRNAINLYNNYMNQVKELKKTYQEKYGPIECTFSNPNKWTWVDDPWPWEVGS